MTDPPARPSIILMGMKHAGKTTLGRRLASHLKRTFVDLDERIQADASSERPVTVRELYTSLGREGFETLEAEAAEHIAAEIRRTPAVVALGGGTIENGRAMAAMRGAGILAFLDEDEDRLYARIMAGGRPAFLPEIDPRGAFTRIYARRVPRYREAADCVVRVDGAGVEDAFTRLLDALRGSGNLTG